MTTFRVHKDVYGAAPALTRKHTKQQQSRAEKQKQNRTANTPCWKVASLAIATPTARHTTNSNTRSTRENTCEM